MKIFQKKKDRNKRTLCLFGLPIFTYRRSLHSSLSTADAIYDLSCYQQKDEGECIVFANGPSCTILLQDAKALNFIKSCPKICMNDFPTSQFFFELMPNYAVFMDPFFWSKDLYEEKRLSYQKIYDALLKVTWKIVIFMPLSAMDWNFFIDLPSKNTHISFQYVNIKPCAQDCSNQLAFELYKNNQAMPLIQNVSIAALFLGINMGYKKLYLLGADQSTFKNVVVKKNNILYEKKEYFYEDALKTDFKPCYFSADGTRTFSVSEWLLAWHKTFKSFEELAEYAEYRKAKIYNTCEGSFIDAFEKVSFQDIKICKQANTSESTGDA